MVANELPVLIFVLRTFCPKSSDWQLFHTLHCSTDTTIGNWTDLAMLALFYFGHVVIDKYQIGSSGLILSAIESHLSPHHFYSFIHIKKSIFWIFIAVGFTHPNSNQTITTTAAFPSCIHQDQSPPSFWHSSLPHGDSRRIIALPSEHLPDAPTPPRHLSATPTWTPSPKTQWNFSLAAPNTKWSSFQIPWWVLPSGWVTYVSL